MKLKIFAIFAGLSLIILAGIYQALGSLKFNAKNYKDIFVESESRCRLNSKLSLDQKNCHEAAARAFFFNREDVAVDVFEYLCSNGYMTSCRVRDWNNYIFSGILFTPPKKDIDSLLRNCFNMKVPIFEKNYYCVELEKIAVVLNDRDTQISIKLMQANFKYSNLKISKEDYFIMDLAVADSYHILKCKNSASSDECKAIGSVYELRMLMHEALVDKNKYSRLKLVVGQICQTSEDFCQLVLNNSHFLTLSFTYRDIDYFKTLPLSFDASQFVMGSIQEFKGKEVLSDEWLNDVKSPFLKYLLLNFDNRHSQIKKECEQKPDKSGCFLGIKDVGEGRKELSLLKSYCSAGDKQSCILVNIYNKDLDKYVDDGFFIYPSFLDYKESLLGWDFTSSFSYKLSSFLAHKRNLILVSLILLLLIFQMYIIHLYSKSSDVFKYIRTKTMEEIKAKIKR
jgi:hypothetical protein